MPLRVVWFCARHSVVIVRHFRLAPFDPRKNIRGLSCLLRGVGSIVSFIARGSPCCGAEISIGAIAGRLLVLVRLASFGGGVDGPVVRQIIFIWGGGPNRVLIRVGSGVRISDRSL